MSSFSNGDTIRITKAVSYMNFFISNEVVLSAIYWKEGMPENEKKKDEEVKKYYKKYFLKEKLFR